MAFIVVGVDPSEGSRRALEWAVAEAKLRQADLRLVHAWHYPYLGGTELIGPVIDPARFEADAKLVLDDLIAAARALAGPDTHVDGVIVSGGAGAALVEESKEADLVVVGARGLGGFSELLLGSVSHQVVHHASCPVVVVRAPAG